MLLFAGAISIPMIKFTRPQSVGDSELKFLHRPVLIYTYFDLHIKYNTCFAGLVSSFLMIEDTHIKRQLAVWSSNLREVRTFFASPCASARCE